MKGRVRLRYTTDISGKKEKNDGSGRPAPVRHFQMKRRTDWDCLFASIKSKEDVISWDGNGRGWHSETATAGICGFSASLWIKGVILLQKIRSEKFDYKLQRKWEIERKKHKHYELTVNIVNLVNSIFKINIKPA